jgi:uncharacterized protein
MGRRLSARPRQFHVLARDDLELAAVAGLDGCNINLAMGRMGVADREQRAWQVREATNHAANACGRLAGAELLTFTNTEASIPDLKERIAKTIDFIKSLKPTQIDGTEDKEITMKFTSGERKFTGQVFLLNFGLPNFFFHCTTAYDILRSCGVEVGKRDFMGTPITLP